MRSERGVKSRVLGMALLNNAFTPASHLLHTSSGLHTTSEFTPLLFTPGVGCTSPLTSHTPPLHTWRQVHTSLLDVGAGSGQYGAELHALARQQQGAGYRVQGAEARPPQGAGYRVQGAEARPQQGTGYRGAQVSPGVGGRGGREQGAGYRGQGQEQGPGGTRTGGHGQEQGPGARGGGDGISRSIRYTGAPA